MANFDELNVLDKIDCDRLYTINRDSGILDFNVRILETAKTTLPKWKFPMFCHIVMKNIYEFLGTRYSEMSMAQKKKFEPEITELLNLVIDEMDTFVEQSPIPFKFNKFDKPELLQGEAFMNADTAIPHISPSSAPWSPEKDGLPTDFDKTIADNMLNIVRLHSVFGDILPSASESTEAWNYEYRPTSDLWQDEKGSGIYRFANIPAWSGTDYADLAQMDGKDISGSFFIYPITAQTFEFNYAGESDVQLLEAMQSVLEIQTKDHWSAIIVAPMYEGQYKTRKEFEDEVNFWKESMHLENCSTIYLRSGICFGLDSLSECMERVRDTVRKFYASDQGYGLEKEYEIQEYFNISCTAQSGTNVLTQPDTRIDLDESLEHCPNGVLFENPFYSYDTVTSFIRKECLYPAGKDSEKGKHRAIFITLYRTDDSFYLVDALCNAASLGTEVFVYVEPMARGNEKENIQIVKRLKKYGCHVNNSFHGLKVHAKAFLSIRSSGEMVAHLSTGNYNFETAKQYTDFQFITKNIHICRELLEFFKVLFVHGTFKSRYDYFTNPRSYIRIAPIYLRDTMIHEIHRSADQINIKCNNLCDKTIIKELTEAADEGVKVNIICRTACSIPTVDRKINVRSKVGSYLEHGRMYQFDDRFYISSADILLRNLNKRVELMTRIPADVCIYSRFGYTSLPEYMYRMYNEANWELKPNSLIWKSVK